MDQASDSTDHGGLLPGGLDSIEQVEVLVPGGIAGATWAAPAVRVLAETFRHARVVVHGDDAARELIGSTSFAGISDGSLRAGRADLVVDLRPPPGASAVQGLFPPIPGLPPDLASLAGQGREVAAFRAPGQPRGFRIHPTWDPHVPAARNMLRLAWLCGPGEHRRPDPGFLSAPLAARQLAASLLARLDRPPAILHPWGSLAGPGLGEDLACLLVEHLDAAGLAPVLVGAGHDRSAAARLVEHVTEPVLDLTGATDPAVLLAVFERAAMGVCSWSGPAVLATAIGLPAAIVGDVPAPERGAGRARTRWIEVAGSDAPDGLPRHHAESLLGDVTIRAHRVMRSARRL